MAWVQRQYVASMAELTEAADRLRTVLCLMEAHGNVESETYTRVTDLLEANRTARVTLQDHWETRHWTAADWAQQRRINRNID